MFKKWQKRYSPLPKVGSGRREPKRKPAKKVPSLHLTGAKSMKYIAEADARTKEKEARIAKEDKIKKEAVNKSQAAERKNKKKSK